MEGAGADLGRGRLATATFGVGPGGPRRDVRLRGASAPRLLEGRGLRCLSEGGWVASDLVVLYEAQACFVGRGHIFERRRCEAKPLGARRTTEALRCLYHPFATYGQHHVSDMRCPMSAHDTCAAPLLSPTPEWHSDFLPQGCKNSLPAMLPRRAKLAHRALLCERGSNGGGWNQEYIQCCSSAPCRLPQQHRLGRCCGLRSYITDI